MITTDIIGVDASADALRATAPEARAEILEPVPVNS